MQKKTLCIPSTSVPSESCFSISSFLGRKERSSLTGENLFLSVFLKDKINFRDWCICNYLFLSISFFVNVIWVIFTLKLFYYLRFFLIIYFYSYLVRGLLFPHIFICLFITLERRLYVDYVKTVFLIIYINLCFLPKIYSLFFLSNSSMVFF